MAFFAILEIIPLCNETRSLESDRIPSVSIPCVKAFINSLDKLIFPKPLLKLKTSSEHTFFWESFSCDSDNRPAALANWVPWEPDRIPKVSNSLTLLVDRPATLANWAATLPDRIPKVSNYSTSNLSSSDTLHYLNLRFIGVGFRGYIIKKIVNVQKLSEQQKKLASR